MTAPAPARRPWRPRSLQGRLLLLLLAALSFSWGVAALLATLDARHELDELLDGHLAQSAALLVAQQQHADLDDDDLAIDAPTLHRYAPQVAYQVWRDGRLTLHSSNAPHHAMRLAGDTFKPGIVTLEIDGRRWRVFAAGVPGHDAQVYVGEQVASRSAILRAVLRGLGWTLALALPLLALAAWAGVHSGLRPLRRLGRELATREPQALQPVQVGDAPTELRPAIEALNALLARIASLLDDERRFTDDAAHELRTPIAAIRTQAQVALAEADEARRAHALRATLEGCDRATRLVEQLLTLARLEGQQALPRQRLDLALLTREVVADLAPQALARGQHLELQADAPCPLHGHDALLRVLVRNLVDNALRYAPAGAAVCVQVRPGPLRLVVDDAGPGLAAGDLARLGQRFFRVAGTGASGSGLGWSIVRRVAAVHGAQVQAGRSATLGGLRVEVTWPA